MIDFDALFHQYVMKWIKQHPELMEDESVEIEEYYPEILLAWGDTAEEALGGRTPREYFAQIEDAEELCQLAWDYRKHGHEIPQFLEQRIIDMKEDAAPYLMKMLQEGEETAQVSAAEMLNSMGSLLPVDIYIALVQKAEESTDLLEDCIQGLINMGEIVRERIIAAFDQSKGYSRQCFMDIMSYLGGEGVLERLLMELRREENVPLAAKCLEHLGDPRALPELKRMLEDDFRSYYEYKALKEAVEDLDMSVLDEKEFELDADYRFIAEHPMEFGENDENNAGRDSQE